MAGLVTKGQNLLMNLDGFHLVKHRSKIHDVQNGRLIDKESLAIIDFLPRTILKT